MTDPRELLRTRRLPTEAVRLPADPMAYAATQRALVDAHGLRMSAPGEEADAAIAAAEAAFAACEVIELTVRCLPPDEWEALVALHPPKPGADGDYDLDGFRPALCAACVVVGEGFESFSVQEWGELVGKGGGLSSGEQDMIFQTAVQINRRAVRVAVGKG
jgi:hypothetical protein